LLTVILPSAWVEVAVELAAAAGAIASPAAAALPASKLRREKTVSAHDVWSVIFGAFGLSVSRRRRCLHVCTAPPSGCVDSPRILSSRLAKLTLTATELTNMTMGDEPVEIGILIYPEAQRAAIHGLTDLFHVANLMSRSAAAALRRGSGSRIGR
jgi:hypothetical protein